MREFKIISKASISRRSHWRQAGAVLLFLVGLLLILTACTSNSGVLGGGSWQAGGLQQEDLQVLATDPNHLQNVYAGDARNGIFVSIDTGVHWKASNSGLPVPLAVKALAFDLSGKKLYAATSSGLFVSSDSATTWSQVTGVPVDSYSALSFDVDTPQVIYVASAHSGVLMSRDNGVKWSSISTGLPTVALTSVLYNADQKVLWTASTSAIYRSSDNGASWREMKNGLPDNVGVNVLASGAVLNGGNDLIFAGTDHGFFLTNDGGQHWAQSQFSLAKLKIRAVLLDASQPAVVYASTDIGVLRSNDSGQNWNQVASGLPGNQPFAGLTQCDVNYTQLLVASRGIYRYPGGGTVFDPGRFIPILLIILFFGFLYYFFGLRRRRLVRRRSETFVDVPDGENQPASSNGHRSPAGSVLDVEEDEQKEN